MVTLLLDSSANTVNNAEMQSLIGTVGMLVLFFVAFYFILIRPQRKKEKELKEQISAMRVGDKVRTIGGLVGVVAKIDDENGEITLYTSLANTPVTFVKSAIDTVIPRNAAQAEKKSDKKAEKKAKSDEE